MLTELTELTETFFGVIFFFWRDFFPRCDLFFAHPWKILNPFMAAWIRAYIKTSHCCSNMTTTYHAISVDPVHFYYVCPYDNCPSLLHRHGSRGNINNRVESRTRHCTFDSDRINVVIDNYTQRKAVSVKRNGSLSFKNYRLRNSIYVKNMWNVIFDVK